MATSNIVVAETRRPLDRERVGNGPDAFVFRGVVVDQDTDAPISGAAVRISWVLDGTPRSLGRARTETDGSFEMAYRLPESLDELRRMDLGLMAQAHAPGYEPEVSWAGGWLEEEDPEPYSIELSPGHHVRVTVVDVSGRPVAGADVSTFFDGMQEHAWDWRAECTTDGYGMAAMAVPAASSLRLSAYKAEVGYGCSDLLSTEEVLDGAGPDLILQPLGNLEGRVVYPDGKPASDLFVSLERVDHDGSFQPWPDGHRSVGVTTDRQGRFTARGMTAGRYLAHDLGGPTEPELVTTGGTPTKLVTSIRRLSVNPRDESGELVLQGYEVIPSSGTSKRPWPPWDISWSNGPDEVVYAVVPGPGDYVVRRSPSEGPPQEVAVSVGPRDYETPVRFLPSPVIPAQGLQARLFDPAGTQLLFRASLATPTGLNFGNPEFSLGGVLLDEDPLPVGRWQLILDPYGGESEYMPVRGEILLDATRLCSIEWVAREPAGRVVVALYAQDEFGGSLVVEFARSRGGEVEYVWETTVDQGPVTGRTVITNRRLPLGTWHARAALDGYRIAERQFTVVEGGASRLELHAHREQR